MKTQDKPSGIEKAIQEISAKRMGQQQAPTKRAISQGIGESRPFIAEGDRDPYGSLRGLHIGGLPIEEVVPPDKVHLITYDHTDEGIAERNAGRSEHRVSVVSDNFDRQLQRMAEREPWEGGDVVGELVQQHIEKGFRARFLSPRIIDRSGRRGWEIVRVNGDPVKLGTLILAKMPEEKAERRNEYFREMASSESDRVREEFIEQGERLSREAGTMGIRFPRPGEMLSDARTNRRIVVGLSSHRGNSDENKE